MSLRYSIYKVQTRCFALAHSFCILSHSVSFVKNFFQVFSNFSEVFFAFVALVSNSTMLAHGFQFVKHYFPIFRSFLETIRSLFRGSCYFPILTPHHQSDRSHPRFSYRQLRRIRRYLHHGKRRRYVPAGSSAVQLLPGSWV